MPRVPHTILVKQPVDPERDSLGYTDKVTGTTLIVQDDLGPGGADLPGDGTEYCGPTAMAMSLLWLGSNGWSQICDDPVGMVEILGGLADTLPFGGTYTDNLQAAVVQYFNAIGMPASPEAFSVKFGPTIDDIAQANQDPTVVTILLGWYQAVTNHGQTTYQRVGGHFIVALTQSDSDATVTIANPAPSSLGVRADGYPVADVPSNAVQTLAISAFTGPFQCPPDPTQPDLAYQQFPKTGKTVPVLECIISFTPDAAWQPGPGWTPAPWAFDGQQAFDTNGANIGATADLSGPGGGIAKSGAGTLLLSGTNTTQGPNALFGGEWASQQASGTPFGGGPISLAGGVLRAAPVTSASTATLSVASAPYGCVELAGPCTLVIAMGSLDTLGVSLGADTYESVTGMYRSGLGSLAISVDAGTSALGGACQVTVDPNLNNLLPVDSGVVPPFIVAQDPTNNGDLDFLQYDTLTGFAQATYTCTDITQSTAEDICSVMSDQKIPAGASVAAAMLRVEGCTIAGSGQQDVLTVGSGLILNEATIADCQVASEGLQVWVNGTGQITASLTGSSGAVCYGPGTLALSDTSQFMGKLSVVAGTVSLSAALQSGQGAIDVGPFGSLEVLGSMAGDVTATGGACVKVAGGTLAGALSVDAESSVAGVGSITGSATLSGQILAGASPGVLDISGAVTMMDTTTFVWTLTELVSGTEIPQQPSWNSLNFAAGSTTNFDGNGAVNLVLDLTVLGAQGLDPNSGNEFWNQSRTWVLFTSDGDISHISDNMSLSAPVFLTGQFYWHIGSGDDTNLYLAFVLDTESDFDVPAGWHGDRAPLRQGRLRRGQPA